MSGHEPPQQETKAMPTTTGPPPVTAAGAVRESQRGAGVFPRRRDYTHPAFRDDLARSHEIRPSDAEQVAVVGAA
jgi:hypothetical protein